MCTYAARLQLHTHVTVLVSLLSEFIIRVGVGVRGELSLVVEKCLLRTITLIALA